MQVQEGDLQSSRLQKIIEERTIANRMRQAVQYCKDTNGFSSILSDKHMNAGRRAVMERCLTQNFLLKFGMDVFGKRDLLYIDMRGNNDVARMYDMEELPNPKQPKEEAPAAEGGDEAEGGDADGDDE